jgi:acetate kinase
MSRILVVNSGSSSFKYQLLELDGERRLASGLVERIGEAQGRLEHRVRGAETVEVIAPVVDHTAGFALMVEAFAQHGPDLAAEPLLAVGHRVVQGGKRFFEPTVVSDLVEINIEDLSELAPLHNPGAVQGIRAARAAFADVPHVAVFDTAFHQTIPDAASTYAIDLEIAERHRIRRYGFHGTSHKFVSEAAAAFLGEESFTGVVLHLGNGASACAVRDGRSVDTSMGMTPLQGLVMGTRSGDIDPAVLIHLQRRAGLSVAEVDDLLNKRSGLLGLTGSGDMRDVRRRANDGDADARRALDVYAHRLRHYLGAYLLELGTAQAIVFTAGVGENDAVLRAELLRGLEPFGIVVDPERNAAPDRGARRISTDDSRVAVLVVPTDEELEIARQAAAVV